LFAGRKLLVADESPYYQKVLGLTFTDEGMEVATAGDGQEALEKLEQSRPDMILASVSMPGMSGYELCDRVKQSERFDHIPVMLLVGLHEPFDQAEAHRVGADDVVTKPFESIRQLVSRVGRMLGGKPSDAEATGHEYSTLGIARADEASPAVSEPAPAVAEPVPAVHEPAVTPETNVTVFVEAASMTDHESVELVDEAADATHAAQVKLQTADTQKLERIDDEPVPEAPIQYAQDDTREMPPVTPPLNHEVESTAEEMNQRIETAPAIEPQSSMLSDEQRDVPATADVEVHTSVMGTPEMNETTSSPSTPTTGAPVFNDAVLDLGDYNVTSSRSAAEDLVLDLEYSEPVNTPTATVSESLPEAVATVEVVSVVEVFAEEPAIEDQPVIVSEPLSWAVVSESPAEPPPAVDVATEERGSSLPVSELTSEVIDAIARRAVEHLSEKVVREIAWEVVPELAELLIKKKLEEQG